MSDRGKLGEFLAEVINWDWKEFCDAEKDSKYTGLQSVVLSLVRTTSEGKLGAIKLAIDRVDGKLETPVKIEYPKVYFLYPEAKSLADPTLADVAQAALTAGVGPSFTALTEPPEAEDISHEKDAPSTAATLTLRQTLNKLADAPRQTTHLILMRKKQVELGDHTNGDTVELKIPLVKSVIAANLIALAEKNNFEAITEVFDQIDGKLVETIRILGDDIYLTQYALEAPSGATKNKDGIYMIEAKDIADQWRKKLGDKG